KRRVSILGLQTDSDLRRIVTQDYRVSSLPRDGLLLTTKLAELLGVRAGQMVTVEILEGKRQVRQVVVAGTVAELIGLSAYMNIDALNQLMDEGASSS